MSYWRSKHLVSYNNMAFPQTFMFSHFGGCNDIGVKMRTDWKEITYLKFLLRMYTPKTATFNDLAQSLLFISNKKSLHFQKAGNWVSLFDVSLLFHPYSVLRNDVILSLRTYKLNIFTVHIRNAKKCTSATMNIGKF